MQFDFAMAFGAFAVAVLIGLTGMGGGALMTPMLVTFFGVSPLAAVSSDLVAAAVMKPVGSVVHYRRGTIDLRLVAWLCAGSVPAAFSGVLVAKALGDGDRVHDVIEIAMGAALLIAAIALAHRGYRAMADKAARQSGLAGQPAQDASPVSPLRIRPIPTAAVGALGGLVVATGGPGQHPGEQGDQAEQGGRLDHGDAQRDQRHARTRPGQMGSLTRQPRIRPGVIGLARAAIRVGHVSLATARGCRR